MKAFAVLGFGQAPAIHDLPMPAVEGSYLIHVKYAGVNPVDSKDLEALSATSSYPFVVGIDYSGILERVPAGERDLKVGDRVFGMARSHGSYAEHTVVPPGVNTQPVVRIPDSVSDEQAAAVPMPGVTALGALEVLQIAPGQHLLVTGGSGGVGGYAVQMARARGVHVLATVREDPDEARRLGAEEVFNSSDGDVIDAIHAAHPEGIDAVLDPLNGPVAVRRDAEILRSGGRLVSLVRAVDEKWFAERHIIASNLASRLNNPMSSPQGLAEVGRLLAAGTITARIRLTGELNDAGKVLEKVHIGGLRGKAILHV
jgi:NADPH:quinone reductase-like Zn-dependent oxidoreductase